MEKEKFWTKHKRLGKFCFHAVVVFTAIFAILFSVLRFITPMLQDYRQPIAEAIEQELNRKIEIGQLQATWRLLGPSLILNDIQVYQSDEKSKLLSIDQMQLGLNLIDSLLNWQWMPDKLEVKHLTAILPLDKLNQESQADSAGLPLEKIEPYLELLDEVPETDFINTEMVFIDDKKKHHLKNIDLYYTSSGDEHQFNLDVKSSVVGKSLFVFNVQAQGELGNIDSLEGVIYSQLNQFSVKHLSLLQRFLPHPLVSGKTSLEFWANFSNRQLTKAQLSVATDNLRVKSNLPALDKLPFSFSANMAWQRQSAESWQLLADQISFQVADYITSDIQLRLEKNINDSGQHYQLQSNKLKLHGLNSFLAAFSELPSLQKQHILDANLDGRVDDLLLDFSQASGDKWFYRLAAELKNVDVGHYLQYPDIKNLNGFIKLSSIDGTLLVDSPGTRITSDELGLAPINFGKLNFMLNWRHQDDEWLLTMPKLDVVTDHLQLQAGMDAAITKSGSPFVDLKAKVVGLPIKHLPDFLPRARLSPDLNKWLDQALLSGLLTETNILLQGNLDEYPFNKNKKAGKFLIHGKLADGHIAYAPNFPAIDHLQADLYYNGHALWADLGEGTISGAKLTKGNVRLPDIERKGHTRLEFTTSAAGDLTQAVDFVKNSKLWNLLGKKLKYLDLHGPMALKLRFEDVLEQKKSSKVNGVLSVTDATANVPEFDLPFTKVNGDVTFDNKGVYAKGLTANLFENPAKIKLDTIDLTKGSETIVAVTSFVNNQRLAKRFENAAFDFAQGKTEYTAVLKDISTEPGIRLQVESQLKGMQFDLPWPLTVDKHKTPALYLDFYWPGDHSMLTNFILGNRLHGVLKARKDEDDRLRFIAAKVSVGGIAQPKLPEQGFWVEGHASRINYNDWHEFIKYMQTHGKNTGFINWEQQFANANLKVADLTVLDQIIKNVQTKIDVKDNQWHFSLDSSRTLGEVFVPFDLKNKPLKLNFKRCNFVTSKDDQRQIQPKDIPALEYFCQKTVLNKRPLGQLSIVTEPAADNSLTLKKFKVESPNYQLNFSGNWRYQNKKHYSAIQGDVHFVDIEKLLNAWALNTDIADSDGSLEVKLSWPRPLSAFGVKNLSGDIKVLMENGRVIDADPGVGKVIGLFNFQNLRRRLTLDFSDVFSKGFTFDYLKGDFALDNGIAYTSNLELDGTPAYIHLSGRSDLVRETVDMQMKVSPHVTGGLPIAAAVATGNPAIGAVVWVVDKVFSSQINDITQYTYKISGPWKKPKIED